MLEVVLSTSFEEHVCFVEEKDSLPASDEVEDLRKTVFKLLGVESKISGTNLLGDKQTEDFFSVSWGDKLERAVVSDIPKPLPP